MVHASFSGEDRAEARPVAASIDVPASHPGERVFADAHAGVKLYNTDCLSFMDEIAETYPAWRFDMIFADPLYFLSNGGITCHAGKMVKVDKGDWDQSRGPEINIV